MNNFILSRRSKSKLEGVHPDLVRVINKAITITEVDFGVTEGLRSKNRQAQLYASGATRTMNSRHLTGHAVDLIAYVGADISWDWPLYYKIADAVKEAAKLEGVPIAWGGDWKSFKDGPHFELDRKTYP